MGLGDTVNFHGPPPNYTVSQDQIFRLVFKSHQILYPPMKEYWSNIFVYDWKNMLFYLRKWIQFEPE